MNADTSIIVGYDGSRESDAALVWAAHTAGLSGDSVVATIVVDPMENPGGPSWPESWWAEIEDRARAVLAEGPPVEHVVERYVGHVVSVLVHRAADASALVVGSRGHGAAGEMFLGSVSQGVARRANVPVVVVRPQQNPESGRIVVGVDGSDVAARALEYACGRAARTGERIGAVHAWGPTQVAVDHYGFAPPLTGHARAESASFLDDVVAKARTNHPEVEIEGSLYADSASRALVSASADASLVVVGSRGRGPLAQVLLGSTSHDVVSHAHCPMAVVR
jgi:nucleotide-binding universal stress UspA family protein